jgi:Predicted esterase
MALLHVQYTSNVLSLNVSMNVLLPEHPCPRPDGLWPTLYLLHGYWGDHTDWQRRTLLERYVEGMNLAVVMPAGHNSFYTDISRGPRYFEHISEEVPTLCERMFPLSSKREDRFVAGLSMGGYGAFKVALRCPDRFAAGASLSGVMDVVGAMEEYGQERRTERLMEAFGTAQEQRGGENDLLAVASRLIESKTPLPRLYMACGTEDFLYENNRSFLAAVGESLGIVYEEGPGEHTWNFWDAYIQRVLKWLAIK